MGGKTTTTPTQSSTQMVQTLSPEQRQLLDIAIPIAKNYGMNPPKLYPGSTIAPQNPLQTQAQGMTLGAIPGMQGLAGGGTEALTRLLQGGMFPQNNEMMQALSFLYGPVMSPSSNPALQGAIDAAIDPVRREFTQTVLPGIRGDAISASQFGGSRHGVIDANASNNYLRTVGDISSTMQNQAYAQNLGAMIQGLGIGSNMQTQQGQIQANTILNALASVPGMMQSMLMPAALTESVGATQRGEQQALLSEQAQRFLAEQMIPLEMAQIIAQMAFGIPAGQTNTTSQGEIITQQPGIGQMLLGGAAMALPFI